MTAGRRRAHGFTLIELMAVIALFALVAAMVAPALDFGTARGVRREADQLASAFEFARQRAVMTGREHQVVIDLDGQRHWVEWAVPPEPEASPAANVPAKIPLVPPPEASGQLQLVPVPGHFGRAHALESDVFVLEVAGDGGAVSTGEVALRLGPDGAADPAILVVGDVDRATLVQVEVLALADAVVVSDAVR